MATLLAAILGLIANLAKHLLLRLKKSYI